MDGDRQDKRGGDCDDGRRAGGAAPVAAQPAVKIGVIAEFSGPFADYGTQIVNGMKTYLKLNGETFGGRKVQIITRDTTGAAPRSPNGSRRN